MRLSILLEHKGQKENKPNLAIKGQGSVPTGIDALQKVKHVL